MAAELDAGMDIHHGNFENSLQDHLSRLNPDDLYELEKDIGDALRACAEVAESERFERFWFGLGANVRPPQAHLELFLRDVLEKIQSYKEG
jgi:hypothetical protein